jgi:hypothetical protein
MNQKQYRFWKPSLLPVTNDSPEDKRYLVVGGLFELKELKAKYLNYIKNPLSTIFAITLKFTNALPECI